MPSRHFCFLAILVVLCFVAAAEPSPAQNGYYPPTRMPQVAPNLPAEMASPGMASPQFANGAATPNPMLSQQYQALQMGRTCPECGTGQACSGNGSSGYNRCGCNTKLFPWISGPGSCDQWCVGPKWAVEAGGLIMFRDDADWNRVIADIGGATTLVDQFDHGPGGRVFVTGYNDSGFGIQVGYEGINDWDANLAFDPTLRAVAPLVNEFREIHYQSRLNSVEINFIPNVPNVWKWYSGFRYVQFDEDYLNSTRTDRTDPTAITPAPATPAGIIQFDNLSLDRLIENRLFGFQLGGRRDAWQFGSRVTLQTYANAGLYCNKFRRDDVDLTITTTITGDDTATPTVIEFTETTTTSQTAVRTEMNEIAFVGEAGISAAWRLNHCTALRAGYQILALDGVGTGLEASFTPGLNDETILFHGLQVGLEYRR